MATSSKVTKTITNRWYDASGTYYYFSVDVELWVDVEPSADGSYFDATFHSDYKESTLSENWTVSGGGFVDCYGLFWDPGSSVGKSSRSSGDQSLTAEQGKAAFMQGLKNIGYSTSDPEIWCVAGVSIRNSDHSRILLGKSGTTYKKRFTKEEYEDINNSYVVLGLGTRWLDQSAAVATGAVVDMRGYELKWSELFPNYIPWSVYYTTSVGTPNYSCNRKTTKETGFAGNLYLYDAGGSKHVVENGGDKDHGFYYGTGNKKTVSPAFGRFKDE